jgi:hypothetical protein
MERTQGIEQIDRQGKRTSRRVKDMRCAVWRSESSRRQLTAGVVRRVEVACAKNAASAWKRVVLTFDDLFISTGYGCVSLRMLDGVPDQSGASGGPQDAGRKSASASGQFIRVAVGQSRIFIFCLFRSALTHALGNGTKHSVAGRSKIDAEFPTLQKQNGDL